MKTQCKSNDKYRFRKKTVMRLFVPCLIFFLIVSCDDAAKEDQGAPYDPSQPVVLTSFSPDSGRIRARVLLEGSNFGTNPENIRVYFNNIRAAVVGSNGNKMYVITPRVAANVLCDVAVVVGNDSVVYPQKFRYDMVVSVTTVVGNGTNTNRMGTLDQASIAPWMIDVDGEDNIFVAVENGFDGGSYAAGIVRINVQENIMELITNLGNTSSHRISGLVCDKNTGIIYTASATNVNSFVTMDPADYWLPRYKTLKWVENPDHPTYPLPTAVWKYLAYCPADGNFYTRFQNGQIVRINPNTLEAMILYITPEGSASASETIGICFDPLNPEWCYLCSNSGVAAHGLYRFNINDIPNTWERLNTPVAAGHRDGPVEQAMFRTPYGLRFDANGYAYICEQGNHCIRRYYPATGIMETMLGIPGSAGYQNGGPEDALFDTPCSIATALNGDVYIVDRNNRRIRKLAIE